jgi:integrase/recombinase XerD
VQGAAVVGALLGLGLAPRSVQLYARTIEIALIYFQGRGWDLARATPEQVAVYAATRPLTFGVRSLLRISLGHYWAFTDHPHPPVKAVRCPPKPAMVCKALDDDDARLLSKAARARHDHKGLVVVLGLYQGQRREEIATTRWETFDGSGWMTVVGKGAKSRTIPVHAATLEALSYVERSSEWVFPGRSRGHASPASIWNWVRLVADEAGVGLVRPHWLRHTCLATQNDRTGDLRAVQHFAGHARSATTEGYTRATKAALRRVSDALDY